MYEKLCAILDALRERGITCKAECVWPTGNWEIVCALPCDYGIKKVRFPVSYNVLVTADPEFVISYVMEGVYK